MVWLGTYGVILHADVLRARLLVEEMDFERHDACGEVRADHHVVSDYVNDDEQAQRVLAEVLHETTFRDENGDVDCWQILRSASAGKQLLR